MTTFLTADTHFGHASIIRSCNRPFASVAEMDEALIEGWNHVVHDRDVVWHLGDFAYADEERTAKIFRALRGTKRLILGNHDLDKKGRVTKALARLPWDHVAHAAETKHDGQRIALSHYAGLSWSAQHHGAYQAYGHSHGKLLSLPGSIDVGVDAQLYRPIAAEEFVVQADKSVLNAEERLLALSEAILDRTAHYAEHGGARFRQGGR
ncbi:MAG: hypothetical protein AB7I79_03065 [Rhizobiaceae bacterium]